MGFKISFCTTKTTGMRCKTACEQVQPGMDFKFVSVNKKLPLCTNGHGFSWDSRQKACVNKLSNIDLNK